MLRESESQRQRFAALSEAFLRVPCPTDERLLARQIAEIGTERSFAFLIQQLSRGDLRAQLAAEALRATADTSLPQMVAQMRHSPDNEALARAFPEELPEETARRLQKIMPVSSDPLCLRWLTEKVARSRPDALGAIRRMAQERDNTSEQLAFLIGLADAGGERSIGTCAELPMGKMNASMVRLMVSSRAMLQLGATREQLLQLLTSATIEDRKFTAGIVQELECTDLMPEVAEAFVFESDQEVLDAFPYRSFMAEALHPSDVGELAQRVGDELMDAVASGCGAGPEVEPVSSVDDAVEAFLERSRRLYDIADEVPELAVEASSKLLHAAVAASAVLSQCRREASVGSDLVGAQVELTDVQLQAASRLWPRGEARVRPCLQKLCGIVPWDYAVNIKARATDQSAEELLDELRSYAADTGSQLGHLIDAEQLGTEARDIRGTLDQLTSTRTSLICGLAGCECAGELIEQELRQSQEREALALRDAQENRGTCSAADYQECLNALPGTIGRLDIRAAQSLLARTNRFARAPDKSDDRGAPMSAVFSEQILQADLLTCLATGGMRVSTDAIVSRLGSDSAAVREAAERLLARKDGASADALVAHLRAAEDPMLLARLLEILRCRRSEVGLSLARAYVSAPHELLRCVAIRYIGSCGEPSDAQLVTDAVEADSELVRMVALEAMGVLDASRHSETLLAFAGDPLFSVRSMVVPGLLRLSQDRISELSARAERSGNYWQRKTLQRSHRLMRTSGRKPECRGSVRHSLGTTSSSAHDSDAGGRAHGSGGCPACAEGSGDCYRPTRSSSAMRMRSQRPLTVG